MTKDLSDQINDLVSNAMQNFLATDRTNYPFQNKEDYKAKTGKRFRMTMAQKDAGLSRDEAFDEFMQELMRK